MSTLALIPLTLALEGALFFGAFSKVASGKDFTSKSLATLLALGGASYYAYNEVAFLALGKIGKGGSHASQRCLPLSLNCLSFL